MTKTHTKVGLRYAAIYWAKSRSLFGADAPSPCARDRWLPSGWRCFGGVQGL